jgi:hypothetical protein
MDGIADDAEIDAGALVGFQQVFDGERRGAAPAALFGQFRRIDVSVPIDNHFYAPSSLWVHAADVKRALSPPS